MIITCPACESRYVVEPNQMGKVKRKVRCASCKHVWEVENIEQNAETQIESLKKRRISPSIPTPSQSNVWVWFVFTVTILIFVVGVILGRHTIMNQWPKTIALYAKLGFKTTDQAEGLQIQEAKALLTTQGEEEKKKLIITGKIVNTSNETRLIPPIRISIEGTCQDNEKKVCTLQTWRHDFAHSRLLPKETIEFESEEFVTATNPDKIIIGF